MIKFPQDWKKCLAFFFALESTCSMLHACAYAVQQRKLSLDSERLFRNKKKKYVLILCLQFKTKIMTNLVSDLFILLSVHPMWGKDGVGQDSHINMTGMLVGKLELNPVDQHNLDIAQTRLRLYSVTPYKEDHTGSKGICENFIRYFFSHNPERNLCE